MPFSARSLCQLNCSSLIAGGCNAVALEGMNRVVIHGLLAVYLAVSSSFIFADEARKVPIVGQAFFSKPSIAEPWDKAFRDGMRVLGYEDGKNVRIVARYANGDSARVAGCGK